MKKNVSITNANRENKARIKDLLQRAFRAEEHAREAWEHADLKCYELSQELDFARKELSNLRAALAAPLVEPIGGLPKQGRILVVSIYEPVSEDFIKWWIDNRIKTAKVPVDYEALANGVLVSFENELSPGVKARTTFHVERGHR